MNLESLVTGFNVQLDIAVGSKPESFKLALFTAIDLKPIHDAGDGFPLDFIPVAFDAVFVLQGFCVGDGDLTASTVTRFHPEIGVGEVRLIQQHCGRRIGRDDQRAAVAQESFVGRDALGPADRLKTHRMFVHRWNRAGNQLPTTGVERKTPPVSCHVNDGSVVPGRIVKSKVLPSPGITLGIQRLARRTRVVSADLLPTHGNSAVGAVRDNLPRCSAGIDDGLFGRRAAHQKSGSVAVLRDRFVFTPVPDHRGDHVAASAQIRCQVDLFESPMHHIRTLRASHRGNAIHIEAVTVVRRDMNVEMLRRCLEFEGLAKMINTVLVSRDVRGSDPARIRRFLCLQGERCQQQNTGHREQ